MTFSGFARELGVWTDFNSYDEMSRIKASLRYADSPARPSVGELIRLHDSDGNSVEGVVEEVHGLIVHVRPEMATWRTEVAITDPFSGAAIFSAQKLADPV